MNFDISILVSLFYECASCPHSCIGGNDACEEPDTEAPSQYSECQEASCQYCGQKLCCPKTICQFMLPGSYRPDLKRYVVPDFCSGIDLSTLLDSDYYFDSGLMNAIPTGKNDIEDMIESLPCVESYKFKSYREYARRVCGACYAAIDYVLLRRADDYTAAGNIGPSLDFMEICWDCSLDYSREEFLKPHVSARRYASLLRHSARAGSSSPGEPSEVAYDRCVRDEKGRYKLWTPKVKRADFFKRFVKDFRHFTSLVDSIEQKSDWTKIGLCRLSFLLMYSGYVTDATDFRNWTKDFFRLIGLERATPPTINKKGYQFNNQQETVYFRDNFDYLLSPEFGKKEREEFGIE